MHLERENSSKKNNETIKKLFSDTEEIEDEYVPQHVIGILFVERERIVYLNHLVTKIRSKNLGYSWYTVITMITINWNKLTHTTSMNQIKK